MATGTLLQVWGTVPYTPSGATTKGDIVTIGDVVGIAPRDIAANVPGELAVHYLATVPKTAGGGTAIAVGKAVFWSSAVATETVSTYKRLGVTAAASLDADTTQLVYANAGVVSLTDVTEAAVVAALTDSTTGTAGATLAAGTGIQTLTIPLTSLATGLSTSAIDLLTEIVPGYRFKVLSFQFVTTVVGAGGGASQTFNLEIETTNVTGGSLNVTLASTDTIGKVTSATAITAANVGTAAEKLSIEMAASGTVFSSGAGYFVLKLQNMDTADAVASLAAKVAAILTSLKDAGTMASA